MPSTRLEHALTLVPTLAPWRRMFPDRTVRRRVQGVELFLPASHLLPDYARSAPQYGQNLVRLAVALADGGERPLRLLDIGANVGDSAAQILARTDAEALCVEADPYWLRYLRRNVGDDPRVAIEAALLTAADEPDRAGTAVRAGGTTHFVADAGGTDSTPALPVTSLRDRHPRFADVRLVKSDTDGFDTTLVPAAADAWRASSPVLFFEFDPTLTRTVTGADPHAVWAALAERGYTELAVWDNGGDPLGRLSINDAPKHAAALEPRPSHRGYYFWDVAAVRADDAAGLAALDTVVTDDFDPAGHRPPTPLRTALRRAVTRAR